MSKRKGFSTVADEKPAANAKLVQYLNEAYGKEKQLEQALQAHISMTVKAPYKKRLQQHLRETKDHAKQLERRIKKLGGKAELGADLPGPEAVTETVANIAGRAVAAAQGPLHALRGTGVAEKMLKNAKDEYHEEHQEIANYTAIETLAEAVGDKDTSKIAKAIRREEERMAKFLEKQIAQLTKDVAKEEIPAAERRTASSSRRRSSSSSRAKTSRASSSSRKPAAKTSRAKTSRAKTSSNGSSASSTARKSSSRSSSSRKSSSRSGGSATRSRAKSKSS